MTEGGVGGTCTHAVGETTEGDCICTCDAGVEGGGLNAEYTDVDECVLEVERLGSGAPLRTQRPPDRPTLVARVRG